MVGENANLLLVLLFFFLETGERHGGGWLETSR